MPGKLNIVALLFLINRLNSYVQISFDILSVNINVCDEFIHTNVF